MMKDSHFEKVFPVVAALLLVPFLAARAKHAPKRGGASQPSLAEGQKLFKENCNLCHYPNKTEKKIGPGLKALFKLKELPESHKPLTEANVREQIEKGSPNAKPMPMPAFAEKLTADQIADVIAYLKTL